MIHNKSELTVSEFVSQLEDNYVSVVKYYADWCNACVEVDSTLSEFSSSNTSVPVYEVNIDNAPELKSWARVKAVPMTIFYRQGRMKEFIFGAQPIEKFNQKLRMVML